MQLSNTFEVRHPVGKVWAAFADVVSVAQCLPGAVVTADSGDGAFEGWVQIKLGPMTAKFEGTANVTRDEVTKTGHIQGQGIDRSGGSRGRVKVDYQVTAAEGGSAVTVDTDISLSGAIAQFGRTGLIEEITKRLIGEFVECLEAKMAASTVEEASAIQAGEVEGFTLFLGGLISWIGKFFRRLFKRDDK